VSGSEKTLKNQRKSVAWWFESTTDCKLKNQMKKITEPTPPIVFDVTKIVSEVFNVSIEEISSKNKTDRIVEARHTAIHVVYNEIFKQTYKPIRVARWFNRVRCCATLAITNVDDWLDIYPAYVDKYNQVIQRLQTQKSHEKN
jgi:hypothetical protein